MKGTFSRLLLFILINTSLFLSCRKNTEETRPSENLSTEAELSLADADLNYLINEINYHVLVRDTAVKPVNSNASSLAETGTTPYTHLLTINLDSLQTNSQLAGIVKCYFTGKISKGTYSNFISTENTTVRNRKLQVELYTVQTKTLPDSNVFSLNGSGIIENKAGKGLSFQLSRSRIHSELKTRDTNDDVYFMEGSWKGTNSQGDTIQVKTTSPLVYKASCSGFIPLQGVCDFTYTSTGFVKRINYGNGSCDINARYIDEKGYPSLFFIN